MTECSPRCSSAVVPPGDTGSVHRVAAVLQVPQNVSGDERPMVKVNLHEH